MDDDYFSKFESVEPSVIVLSRENFEAGGFEQLLKTEVISVKDLGDSKLELTSRIKRRTEPLFGSFNLAPYSTCLSELRTHRPEKIGEVPQIISDQSKCTFCPERVEKDTPEPRIHHDLTTPAGRKVISFPNLYPFTQTHLVTVFADHKPDIIDLTYKDMVNYFASMYEIAERFKARGAKRMWSFINWGVTAGASQSHPHAQHGTGFGIEGSLEDRERIAIESIATNGTDPFEDYMAHMRNSQLFIFENDCVFITAPYAPRFPDQVDVICKHPAMNILETQEYRGIMIRSMLGLFHMLRVKRGVTDLNLVWHQAGFDHDRSKYRLHAHITPRNKNRIAGREIDGFYVIPVDPEKTASEGREWYSRPN